MWAFSLYNIRMKSIIEQRLKDLSVEIESLHEEKQNISQRSAEIQVRMHQLVGAIYELQQLTVDLDRQSSLEHLALLEAEQREEAVRLAKSLPAPSVDVVQGIHQEQQAETEKNSQQQS